jgi:hypothetical protein
MNAPRTLAERPRHTGRTGHPRRRANKDANCRTNRPGCTSPARPPTPTTSPSCAARCMPRWSPRRWPVANWWARASTAPRSWPSTAWWRCSPRATFPGENNCGPIVHDDPFLADGTVRYLGQPVAVVVAREMLYAREAAAKRAGEGVRAAGHHHHRAGAGSRQLSCCRPRPAARRRGRLRSPPRRTGWPGSTQCGQQEQFYLEGHITYAVPREDGQLTLYCPPSTPTATSAKPRRR